MAASIAAPWRVTPSDAVIIAVTILGLVAFSAGCEWRRRYCARRLCRVMMQLVQRSNASHAGRPPGWPIAPGFPQPPIDEVREAVESPRMALVKTVEDARVEMRRALPWTARYPATLRWFLPTWPLPPDAVERIEREFDFKPLLKAVSPIQAARSACWCLASSIAAFMLVWANQPAACGVGARVCSGALAGLDARPPVGSFAYLAFNAVVANTPADVGPRSPAAHLVLVATWLAALAILGIFGKKLWKRIRLPGT